MTKSNKPFIKPIVPADIEWRDGQPYSCQFNDVYFSKENGLAETNYVFLEQNKLQTRWQQGNGNFIIAETGFGTGLNFLAACRLWLDIMANGELHYISVDKHPLTKKDIQQALQSWPELADYGEILISTYPALTPGWHRVNLFAGRVVLTLYFGEVDDFLADSGFQADAWFLDGFAPGLNQAMWTENVYQRISLLSKFGASFSTYTAAGHVRRGLQAAGFTVNKVKGYANKRELLSGQFTTEQEKSYPAKASPWFFHTTTYKQQDITIIGAGLAGAFTAKKFAECGYKVTVIEAEGSIAQKASGNKQAMIYCRFSAYASLQYDFYHQAYLHSVSCLQKHQATFQTGLLDIPYDDKSRERFRQLKSAKVWPEDVMTFLNAQQATELTGMPVNHEAIYMPQGGYVNPVKLCENLLAHKNITIKKNCHVNEIKYQDEQWLLLDRQSNLIDSSPLLVLTTAEACLQFEQCAYLPLKSIRGQVSHISENENSKCLQMPICYEGYIAPSQNGEHSLGASFNLHDNSSTISQKDDQDNIHKLKQHLPDIYREMRLSKDRIVSSRVGFRCHAPDYLPVVGPLPDVQYFEEHYQGLRYGKLKKNYKQGRFIQGLFLNVAHGSRGVVSAPLSAELLYSYVCQQGVFPVGEGVRYALHPARFILKDIKRNK